jgi:hypothetical protein
MVIGAIIASSSDLAFNWFGYTFLTVNNVSSAAQGVVMKKKLANRVQFDNLLYVDMNDSSVCSGFQSQWTSLLQLVDRSVSSIDPLLCD